MLAPIQRGRPWWPALGLGSTAMGEYGKCGTCEPSWCTRPVAARWRRRPTCSAGGKSGGSDSPPSVHARCRLASRGQRAPFGYPCDPMTRGPGGRSRVVSGPAPFSL
ncbi:hypothetical protein TMGG_03718 [Mycobacterium tuberculosis SUMu007]|nr:hypothetical protein TMGG_03718 [Mycobacterium tuberculosis SUMu007]